MLQRLLLNLNYGLVLLVVDQSINVKRLTSEHVIEAFSLILGTPYVVFEVTAAL